MRSEAPGPDSTGSQLRVTVCVSGARNSAFGNIVLPEVDVEEWTALSDTIVPTLATHSGQLTKRKRISTKKLLFFRKFVSTCRKGLGCMGIHARIPM